MADAVVKVLLERLITSLVNEGRRLLELDGQFDKLKEELIYIKNLINEACKVRRKDQSDNFKKVISDLKELVYDAEDIIEESQLIFMKLQDGYLSNFISCCSPQLLKFRHQMANRLIIINQGIQNVKNRMTSYLDTSSITITRKEDSANQRLRYPILIDEANIVGLENDSAKIRGWIFEADRPFMVIGIVGMGGVGKTTLAKKICNSHSMKHAFIYSIFVVVSQNFKLEDIVKKMLKEMKVDEDWLRENDIEQLLRRLRRELKDNTYLLVLDDVWGIYEENWWESLEPSFPKGNGCCVIVTSRNAGLVKSMGAIDRRIYHLETLSFKDSWSLFTKVAFAWNNNRCSNPDLVPIGKEIVAGCGGLPLAIKVVGRMMLGKGDSVHEWRRISEHLKEELVEEKEDEPIMSSLVLSYDELPAYLKPCFLCFSMFPEDEEVVIDDIVYWWISEGFVSGMNGRTAVEIGRERATELINRCLLVGENNDTFRRHFVTVKIHDLVRDMVIKIARDENFISSKGRPEFNVQSRRLSIFSDGIIKSVESKKKKKSTIESKLRILCGFNVDKEVALDNVESKKTKKSTIESKLRILCGFNVDKEVVLNIELRLCKLKLLRVLNISLSRYSKDQKVIMKDWLEGISLLPHLVFLTMVNCELEKLPDAIGNLHNLQFLKLVGWENLEMLPLTITKLEKLTAIEVFKCESFECMPDGIGRLSNLEILLGFRPTISSHKYASRISHLKNLGQLKELYIEFTNSSQLEEGELNGLSELQHLRLLSIKFANNDEITTLVSKPSHQLSPFPRLEELWLMNFPGESTPVWLNPSSFPNLLFLAISRGNLMHMGPEFLEGKHGVWKIERVFLKKLYAFEEEWERFHGALPSLRMARVSKCPKLSSFPLEVTTYGTTWWRYEDNATWALAKWKSCEV